MGRGLRESPASRSAHGHSNSATGQYCFADWRHDRHSESPPPKSKGAPQAVGSGHPTPAGALTLRVSGCPSPNLACAFRYAPGSPSMFTHSGDRDLSPADSAPHGSRPVQREPSQRPGVPFADVIFSSSFCHSPDARVTRANVRKCDAFAKCRVLTQFIHLKLSELCESRSDRMAHIQPCGRIPRARRRIYDTVKCRNDTNKWNLQPAPSCRANGKDI